MTDLPPSLTPQQMALVQGSLARALPEASEVAGLFYDRLFALDPSLRALFLGDMAAQGRKLVDTLDVFAGDLTRLPALRPAMRRLGQRHADYGVRPEHYATVSEALLWALEQALGEGFTPEVRGAWEAAYAVIAREMLSGTNG
ncbi:globin family protein [Deinococcus hopiensis]|uniref:Nitric oxide dioxygenase n=1 Tax=Deinococcus hopiensis KR-140 TaxID=695939 RepID=A0A1W1UB38_9DEIO|nr:globin family protein [Deinococcus hopiensis]SMB78306.1 nitric oxide dioxygenase [Deinococcus hopiensis KR-140]